MPAFPYDITLTIQSGPNAGEYGFMLVTPRGETKQLVVDEVGGPEADRISTDDAASHSDFAPEQDTPFAQAGFAGGLGQLSFDNNDETAYWWGSAVVTHIDGKAYLAPPAQGPLALGSSTASFDGFTTYITSAGVRWDFAWSGTRLYRRPATDATSPWVLVWTSSSGDITDFEVFNATGVIATPDNADSGQDFWTQADVGAAAPWTPTARNHSVFSNGFKPKLLCGVRGTLFATVDPAGVYFTVDPTQDGWVGPIEATVGSLTAPEVGDRSYPFVNLIAANDYLFAFKRSAGYNIDSSQNVSEVLWQWKERPSEHNFRFICSGADSFGAVFYYTVGPEVYAYDPGTGSNLALRLAKRDGFSVRQVLGLGADNQYVYMLAEVMVPRLRSAPSVALLRGHRTSGTRWAFECLWEDTDLSGDTYGTLGVAPSGVGTRIYWGVKNAAINSGETSTYVMDIPAEWDESEGSSFAASGVLYTSVSRANFPGLSKRHLWLVLESLKTQAPDVGIAVAYSLDEGATFTTLDTTYNDSAKWDFVNTSGRSVVLRFTLTGTGAVTPVMLGFDHHMRVRFRYLPTIQASLRIADHVERNNGTRDERTGVRLTEELIWLRQEEGEVLYEDYLGHRFNVSVDNLKYRPTRHEDPESKAEREALLTLSRADSGV